MLSRFSARSFLPSVKRSASRNPQYAELEPATPFLCVAVSGCPAEKLLMVSPYSMGEQKRVRRTKLLKYVGAGDYNIHLLEPGDIYRDC